MHDGAHTLPRPPCRCSGFLCESSAIRGEIIEGSGSQLSIVYAWRPPATAVASTAQ